MVAITQILPLIYCKAQKVRFVKGTVSRDGYFFEDLNLLLNTFCVCSDGFVCLSSQNYFLCGWTMFSSPDLSLAAGKMRKNYLSHAASCMSLQSQIRRFMVFEAGYWKDFKN